MNKMNENKIGPKENVRSDKPCSHKREMSECKKCEGSSRCSHGKRKNLCKECGGSSVCSHGREKRLCKRSEERRVGKECRL